MTVPDTEFVASFSDIATIAVTGAVAPAIEDAIAAQDIPGQVADQVVAETTGLSLVLTTDLQRVARAGKPADFRVLDTAGRKAFTVNSSGSVNLGPNEVKPRTVEGFAVKDTTGKKALEVLPSGAVLIENVRVTQNLGTPTITKVHILIAAGQSLSSGRAHIYGPALDPADSRIMQFGATSRTLTVATVPLDMHDTSTGLAPVTVTARIVARELPPGEIVLIIPAAYGGTGLITDTTGGCWDPAYTGTNNHLYSDMLSQIDGALAAIATTYPSATIDWMGMMWNQGEADTGSSTDAQFAQYLSTFVSLVSGLRTHITQPNLPIVIGEMGPEWAAFTAAQKIRAQHVAAQNSLQYCALVRTPRNTANYDTDSVHQSREGVTGQGTAAREGLVRAQTNFTGTNPMPPAHIWARRDLASGAGLVEWSNPYCRVDSFIVEYSTNNGTSWTAATRTDTAPYLLAADYQQPFTGLTSASLLWRVSTVNSVGTSATSKPVPTLGI